MSGLKPDARCSRSATYMGSTGWVGGMPSTVFDRSWQAGQPLQSVGHDGGSPGQTRSPPRLSRIPSCTPLAARQQSAQPGIAQPIQWVGKCAQVVAQVEPATDDRSDAGLLGAGVGARSRPSGYRPDLDPDRKGKHRFGCDRLPASMFFIGNHQHFGGWRNLDAAERVIPRPERGGSPCPGSGRPHDRLVPGCSSAAR